VSMHNLHDYDRAWSSGLHDNFPGVIFGITLQLNNS
jgi:hypothetical protein